MASYEINLSDGSKPYIIPENVIDKDQTSIALVGHGQPNYGQDQNENFLHMLEHFSSEKEPNMPIRGQLWFKQSADGKTYEMRICRQAATVMDEEGNSDAVWDKILKTTIDDEGEPTNPSNGDIWYDYKNHKFNIYDDSLNDGRGAWNTIGPHDAIHNTVDYYANQSSSSMTTSSYIISSSNFMKDIFNIDDDGEHPGSLHLVTLKVLIKEAVKPNEVADINTLRSAALIYRFVIRTLSSDNGKVVSLLGAPNYEILAKSDNLDFTMDISISAGNVVFTINNDSASSTTKTYFVNGIDMDITRV